MKKHLFLPVALAITLFSCQKDIQESGTDASSVLNKTAHMQDDNPDDAMLKNTNKPAGSYVYTETNDGTLNKIVIYKQHADGSLSWWKEVASGGKGTGAGLGSQGALCMSEDHQWLFAVNAGSNSFSVFHVHADGNITLKATVNSMGEMPNSITSHGNLVYVLNHGSSTICGFMFSNGVLTKTSGSPHNLSGTDVDAPQVMFAPDGNSLIVTEKKTNLIDDFTLDAWGGIVAVVYNKSVGAVPFGFAYARKYLIVSDAGDGACTSYKERGSGLLHAINGAVPDGKMAACWVATAKYGYYAYAADAASNTVSSFSVDATGALTYLSSANADLKPLDMIVSADNKYLYCICAGAQKMVAFKRGTGGVLTMLGDVNITPYAVGLATF